MPLYNPKLEQRVLVTITDSHDRARNHLMSQLRTSWFGYEPALEVYEHVARMMREGAEIPTARTLAMDSGLTDRARSFLQKGQGRGSKHPARMSKKADLERSLKYLSKYRKQRICHHIGNLVGDELEKENPDHEDLFEDVEKLILQARRGQGQSIVHIGQGDNFNDDFEDLLSDESIDLIPTGWKPFDAETGGFGRTDLVFLAANYGGGKTTVALDMAKNVYKEGYSVCVVSLEMPRRQVWARVWSNETKIEFSKFRLHNLSGDDKKRIRHARKKWMEYGKANGVRFSVWNPGALTPTQMINELKAYGFDLIIVDYINLFEMPSGKDERIALGEMARTLKLGAGENFLNCPIVVLAQLNDENRIKYSRAMAEHADYILWWRRDDEEKITHYFDVHQDKARNARQYSMKFREDFSTMSVEALHEIKPETQDTPKEADEDPKKKPKKRNRPRGAMDGLTLL